MDLGIAGKWALVCGASKGLGLGCAQALVREGVNVVIVARGAQVFLDPRLGRLVHGFEPSLRFGDACGGVVCLRGLSRKDEQVEGGEIDRVKAQRIT